jgi:cysteinyl-tRNA synthetase
MSLEQVGLCCHTQTLDIHAGGVDLIFPHHEDEIAQAEAATGQPFARYWLHGEFLNVRGTKMSKRFGNFLTARDLRDQGVDAAAVRLLFWQTHYRKALDFTDAALAAAGQGVKRLGEFRERLVRAAGAGVGAGAADGKGPLAALATQFETQFRAALDDDLNAPQACAALFSFVHEGHGALDARAPGARAALGALARAMAVLDILPTERPVDPAVERWITERVAARDKARQAKDFSAADRIRAELKGKGVEIEDGPAGTTWRRV